MRISFQMLSREPMRNIMESLERYTRLQTRAGSGKRIQKPSDDPLAATKAMGYKTLLKQNKMFASNAGDAGMYLNMVDSSIISVKNVVDKAKALALEMRSSTSDVGEVRQSSAAEVEGMIGDLKDLLNTEFNDKYLFAGHMTTTKPFVEGENGIRYMGDDNPVQFRVAPNRRIDATIPGSVFLNLGEGHIMHSGSMEPDLTQNTGIELLNEGEGINEGTIIITDDSGTSEDIDLTGVEDIHDIVDRINASGLNIMAGINAATTGLSLFETTGGAITVEEAGEGTTAADLGILGTSTTDTLVGSDLNPIISRETRLINIDSVSRFFLERMRINTTDGSYLVDLSSPSMPETVGDILDRINNTVPGLEARINSAGDGIELVSDQPITIEEDGGSTADELGLLGESSRFGPYSLFGSMESLREALLDNDADALDSIIGELQVIIDRLMEIEAEVGAKGKNIDMIETQLEDSRTHLTGNLSRVEDVEMSEVLTELAQAQVAYQAALQTASLIYDISLLDYFGP